MSFNGSGSFLINTAGQPVVSGTVISSTAFNALTADLATGLSTCITKDGQTTVTANIPMANYKFTGLGAGSAAADSANLSQVQSTVVKLLASVSGTDTITAVGSPTVAAYAAGQMFYFVAAGDNTGAVTINIDSLGAKNVTRDGSVALAAGDIKSGEVVVIVYDGTRFQVVSQLNSSGDARFANVSIASALNVGGVATVTGGSVLNGGVVINEPGADVDFRVEGDTDANLIFADASTDRVGVGTNAPGGKFHVTAASGATAIFNSTNNEPYIRFDQSGASKFFIGESNAVGGGGAGFYDLYGAAGVGIRFFTAAAERLRLDTSGNLGLGVTPSAWDTLLKAIVVEDTAVFSGQTNSEGMRLGSNWYYNGGFKYQTSAGASRYDQSAGAHSWFTAASGTAGNAITFTQAMTLTAGGVLGIGTASPNSSYRLTIDGVGTSGNPTGGIVFRQGGTDVLYFGNITTDNNTDWEFWNPRNGYIRFGTNNNERARITSGGNFLVGQTASGIANVGISLNDFGRLRVCTNDTEVAEFNRLTSDGDLLLFYQDTAVVGSISVSGNTVSYNAFAGSHWSQLQDGSKPDILRGTVMESINELCVWPGEQNERLPKSKISDTAGSKKVYGVFMAWDNDWTTTNDMYVTAVGAFICRVNGSVTVQEGDLLESNGDGTARVQADDIIRSSTIGKVTSTVKTHEYDDGSYCVPTVLYCG
jgi:hypothetical protein